MKDLYQVIKDFLLQKVVPFLTKYVVRWSIKFVGSVLVYLGYTQTQYEEVVSGLVLFVVGILWTLFTDKVLGKKDTLQ
jgi:hypothetical protein